MRRINLFKTIKGSKVIAPTTSTLASTVGQTKQTLVKEIPSKNRMDVKTSTRVKSRKINTFKFTESILSAEEKATRSTFKNEVNREANRVKKEVLNDLQKHKKGQIVTKTKVLKEVLLTLLDSVGKEELIPNFKVDKAIAELLTFHNNLISFLGIEFGTKKYKQVTNYCIQLLEQSTELSIVDRLSTGKKDKWPNGLGELRPLFHQVRDNGPFRKIGDQVIRTLFSMQRVVEDFNEIDIKNIEYSAKIDPEFLKSYEEFVIKKYEEFGIVNGIGTDEKGNSTYKITPPLSMTAYGPNKAPKTESAAYEAYLLLNSKELHPPFKRMCLYTNNTEFYEFMKEVGSNFETLYYPKGGKKSKSVDIPDFYKSSVEHTNTACLRKLTSVADVGNKARVVAIPDYWTQCLLTPMEQRILETIKEFYPDCSNIFDHSGGFEKLRRFIKKGTVSMDAQSWTDTFSVKFQRPHLKCLYNAEFSSDWSALVARCKWSIKGTEKFIFYRTGQGMGTRGSFALASLGYLSLLEFVVVRNYPHLIKRNANGRISNLMEIFNQVGDDLWGQDPDGLVYADLTNKAGIPVNKSKSKFATEANLVGEFVSRNLNFGNDVSRISTSLCAEVEKNIFYLTNLFIHIEERTKSFDWDGFIKRLSLIENSNGKSLYPTHIWEGYYRCLVIDRIVRNDNQFGPLLNALEKNISSSKDGADSILSLRGRLKNPKKDVVFRIHLNLIDCEYMYSKIDEVDTSGKNFLRKFPFGTYTKVYNGSIFNIGFIKNLGSFEDLSLLYIYSKIKDLTEHRLFKLSLGQGLAQKSLEDILNATTMLREELSVIHDSCFMTKKDRKADLAIKSRMDRSYFIQKALLSYTASGDYYALLANSLPNLELMFEMDHKDFCDTLAQLDDLDYSDVTLSSQPNA